jgi:hypothetical protein
MVTQDEWNFSLVNGSFECVFDFYQLSHLPQLIGAAPEEPCVVRLHMTVDELECDAAAYRAVNARSCLRW